MTFDLIPILIILISLAGIIFIVVKKFPQMANVDVEQLPEEKQAQLKNKILEKQFEKKFKIISEKLAKFFSPVTKILSTKFNKLKEFFVRKKNSLEKKRQEIEESEKSKEDILHDLLDEGADLMEEEKYNEAEAKFIKALEVDKSVDIIYQNLAEIYVKQKKYDYAIEVFMYLISLMQKKISRAEDENDKEKTKLLQQDLAKINFELAQTYKILDNIKEAKRFIDKALLIDFRNPKYLDFLCEISIILKDKLGVESCVAKLREVNADNKKIEKWEAEIEKMD